MKCLQLLLILALGQVSVGQQPTVALLPGSAFAKETSVRQESGERSVTIQQRDLQVKFSDGKTGYFKVFGVMDHQDHGFWWISFPGSSAPDPAEVSDRTEWFLDNYVFRTAAGKIVGFWPSYPFSLKVLSSDRVCMSEQQCWDGVYREIDQTLLGDYFQSARGIVSINLKALLGDEFAQRKEDRMSASVKMFLPVIESVDHAGGKWTVRVQGPNKDEGIVVLDDKFAVVAASHVEK